MLLKVLSFAPNIQINDMQRKSILVVALNLLYTMNCLATATARLKMN